MYQDHDAQIAMQIACSPLHRLAYASHGVGVGMGVLLHSRPQPVLSLVHAPERSLSHLVATDHDRASWCDLQGSRNPSAPQPRDSLFSEYVPEKSHHRSFLGCKNLLRSKGRRTVFEDLSPGFTDIKRHGQDRGRSSRRSTCYEAICESRHLVFAAL